jgi:hypothetical protein
MRDKNKARGKSSLSSLAQSSGGKGAGAGCYGPPWPFAGCAAQGRVLPIPQCPTRLESFKLVKLGLLPNP